MESQQQKALRQLLFMKHKNNIVLRHVFLHTIDFSKLSEDIISLIYNFYSEDKEIMDLIPSRFLDKKGKCYNECCYCNLAHTSGTNGYCPVVKMDYDGIR